MNLLLAHGVLGFGAPADTPTFANYFNGVAGHLRRRGHTVATPQVNPVGSIAQRGEQLGSAILKLPQLDGPLHVLAHSMGGLDARYALAHVNGVADRVTSLVTIGTPHRGSPVADAIAKRTGPLFAHLPTFVVSQLQRNAAALHDLSTAAASHFDDTTPDVAGVRYVEVAGDASQGGHELFLFQVAALIGALTNEPNDGVVTKTSALRSGHEHLPDWPADHAGEIGWSFTSPVPIEMEFPFLPEPAHFARYDAIIDRM